MIPLSRSSCWQFSKESINELSGPEVGHLVPETGPCAKNWATEQGSGPNLEQPATQIRANTGLLRHVQGKLLRSAQDCTATSSGYLCCELLDLGMFRVCQGYISVSRALGSLAIW